MNRVVVGALAMGMLCLAGVARAQTGAQVTTFVTIDSVKAVGTNVVVTGIVQGETAPREIGFYSSSLEMREECRRFALLAMMKPGQFLLDFIGGTGGWSLSCELSRVSP